MPGSNWNLSIMSGPIAEFIETYKVVIGILTAFVYITIIIIFAINVFRLGSFATHPIQRKKIMDNILISLVCLVLVSCFGIFYILVLQLGFGAVS